MQPFADQRVGEAEHQGRVAVGFRRQPLGAEIVWAVVAHRRDRDELHAGLARLLQPDFAVMGAAAAGIDLHVADIGAAEHHHQLGVLGDAAPGRHRPADRRVGADDMRQKDHAGGVGIVRHLIDAAARGEEEAAELRARVMEAAGARPAVRAAEDALRAMLFAHARQFAGDESERLVPAHFDEAVFAAIMAAIAALLQPAFAHRRFGDARRRIERVHHAGENRRGLRVAREGADRDDAAVLHLDRAGAPMGAGETLAIAHYAPFIRRRWRASA